MKAIELAKDEMPYEVVEEMKILRTNLLFCGDDKRVLLVTSCFSGEGKSVTAIRIARTFAELGYKTLVVDADLRKSKIRDRLANGEANIGLTHYLSGQAEIDDALYYDANMGIFVIPDGASAPNPSELLSGTKMQDMLVGLRRTFDYIIIDCAPLGLVVDAAVIAPYCDGCIELLEANSASFRMAQEVANRLRATGTPLLGAVLNKVDRKRGKYYGKYYGHYGRYGHYGHYYKRYESYYKK